MRQLSDYHNDDGQPPNGQDDGADDSQALRRALADGPGIVQLPSGYFRCGDICVPESVTVQGAGPATVIRSSGPAAIFRQEGVYRWVIRDLVLDGEAEGDWKGRRDLGRSGLRVERCKSWEITGVRLSDFEGAALHILHNDASGPEIGWCDGGNLERITAERSFVGVHFDVRAEYGNAAQLSCYHNVTGCAVHAGNAKLTASNFCSNLTGLYIEDGDNGSHGSVSNCLINHNEKMGLHCRQARNGMTISNCCIFCGELIIEDCAGVNLTSGIISCDVRVRGDAANRISGNYIIPGEYRFEMAPPTLVQDNFTDAGPWEMNTRV